ncbi:MAG: PEGA domain-containing protein [Archangium sp.]|nr:PEGA domain-containing protein [Archangium sp.]
MLSSEVLAQVPVPNRALGVLSITTSPAGATVELVDPQARSSKGTTPLTIPLAVVGRWQVKAVKEGFGVEQTSVDVSANETTSLSLPLRLAVALAVTGLPDDARVTVTGPQFHSEGALPWIGDGLTAGSYVVSVSREGAEPFEWSGVLAPGGIEHIVAVLKPDLPSPVRTAQPMRCVLTPPAEGRSQAEQDEFDERRALETFEQLKRIIPKIEPTDEVWFTFAHVPWEVFCAKRRNERTNDHRGSELYRREVVRLFERLLHESPDFARNDEVLFNLASNFQAVGETDRALGRWAELLERFPASPFAPAARLGLDQGRIAAERDARTRTRALSELGWCDFSSGNLDRSARRFRQVMARDPILANEALRGLVSVLVKQRRFSEARAALKNHELSAELNWLHRMVDRASRE